MFWDGSLSTQQLAYLTPKNDEIHSRYFYLLPKIHKARSSWPLPTTPPGRPIVSDIDTESSRICAFIDYHLQPLSILHTSYIKDTYHFVQKIKNQVINPEWLLITADVESLYTNMRIDIILDSIRNIFHQYPDPARPETGLMELLELTLRNNDFEFNGQFFLQILGIAMGRKYAPAAANIYLRQFDESAMHDYPIQPKLYSRFLDDIFAIWPGTRTQLQHYENFLNNLIPGIKVTFTARDQVIEFLDTQVYKSINCDGVCTLQTKVFFKNTDTHQLLHRSSFHPNHTFQGIVKSQFIRFKRISSTFHDYQQASSTLIHVLRDRGYSKTELIKQKRRIWHEYDVHQAPSRNKESQTSQDILPVVTYYDRFHNRLNRAWCAEIRCNPVFQNIRIISAYRRHKNLKNLLVRGRFKDPEHSDPAEALLDALINVILQDPDVS